MQGESSDVTATAALEFLGKHAKAEARQCSPWSGSGHRTCRMSPREEDLALYPNMSPKNANFFGEITGMDRAVGKLRKGIADLGLRDNTIFWYCSDNGGLRPESSGGRARKGRVFEGGLRVPAILEWPAKD